METYIKDQKSVSTTSAGAALQVPVAAPLALPEEPEACGDDVSTLEPEALVAALDVPATAKQAAAEITKRLELTPKANRFAYRVLRGWSQEEAGLLTPKDDADLADACDGLRRVCFKAIGILYATGDRPPCYVPQLDDWVTTDRQNTAIFLEDRILELLKPYRPLSERELLMRALKGEFKNLPRAIRFDLIDLIRKQYTEKAQALNFLSFDATPALLNAGVPASGPNAEHAIELLTLRQDELVESLGRGNYETLLVAADFCHNDDRPDSKQSRKSGLTAAIARVHGVGARQARYLKKELHEATTRALEDEGSAMSEIFETLYSPNENIPSRRRYRANQEGEYLADSSTPQIEWLEEPESVAPDDDPAAVLAEIPE